MIKEERAENGRFVARGDSLGKAIGIRVRKDLEPILLELAKSEGVSVTEWCRKHVEKAIATATKQSVKKSKAT